MPANPAEYLRTMYDLIVLALQTDATRVVTYMVAREDGMGMADQFPVLALGLKSGHHALSHDRSMGFFERWARYDQFQAQQLAYFLERMARTRDEHGTLLENTLVLYGSACSTTHDARNYPLDPRRWPAHGPPARPIPPVQRRRARWRTCSCRC